MNRNLFATISSSLVLSAAMVVWTDLFIFLKGVQLQLPAWTESLPNPIYAPTYLVLMCLMPAAFVPNTLANALVAILTSVLLSSLVAITAYALNPTYQGNYLLANMFFNYWWIILFHCAVPSLLLVATRIAAHYIRNKIHG